MSSLVRRLGSSRRAINIVAVTPMDFSASYCGAVRRCQYMIWYSFQRVAAGAAVETVTPVLSGTAAIAACAADRSMPPAIPYQSFDAVTRRSQ